LGNLIIWDTPGLGDTVENDKAHFAQIVGKLSETNEDGKLLIDLVLVVLDAGSKDMAVPYELINSTLIPNLGKYNENRILIVLNRSDMAMCGRHWDRERNAPDLALEAFLAEKAESVKRRVRNETGVAVEPVYYCAGYTDGEEKQKPWNLSKLLFYVLMDLPPEKRLVLVDELNGDEENWESNDGDYILSVKESFLSSFKETVIADIKSGAVMGGVIIGIPGALVGGLIGSIVGGLRSLVVLPVKKLIGVG
jgi:hypothetical protein